jgi:hypothetical protein
MASCRPPSDVSINLSGAGGYTEDFICDLDKVKVKAIGSTIWDRY